MHVAISGAGGAVGRVVAREFDTDRRTLFTHSDQDDLDSRLLDATDRHEFIDTLRNTTAVEDVDALVHLAWGAADSANWNEDHEENVRMTANAFEAALDVGVDRVVVASSAHVVGMYNRDDPANPESMASNPTETVDTESPVRPDSFYGVAKVAVEGLASYYADRYDIEAVIVRIGWLMTADELRETQSDPADRHRFARAMWLSPRDCRRLFRAAVEGSISRSPVVAHGLSRNGDRSLTLTETAQQIGYRPKDDASEVIDS